MLALMLALVLASLVKTRLKSSNVTRLLIEEKAKFSI